MIQQDARTELVKLIYQMSKVQQEGFRIVYETPIEDEYIEDAYQYAKQITGNKR